MPISLVTGLPRSGKSYNVVARIIVPALKAGRTVITNIPLTNACLALGGQVIQLPKDQRDMSVIASLLFADDDCTQSTVNAGAVFVLDEFSMLLPSGIRQDKIPTKVKMFFAMHGHTAKDGIATEIVIISQAYTQINAYVTGLVETTYHCEKKDLGFKKSFNLKIYSGAGRTAVFNRVERHFYNVDNYSYYKSQTLNNDLNASEQTVDDAGSLLKLPALKWGALVIFIVLPLAIYFAAKSFGNIAKSKDNEDIPSLNAQSNNQNVPALNAQSNNQNVPALNAQSNNQNMPALNGASIYLAADIRTKRYHRIVFVLRFKDSDVRIDQDDLRSLGYTFRRLGNSYVISYKGGSYIVPPLPDEIQQDMHPVVSDINKMASSVP